MLNLRLKSPKNSDPRLMQNKSSQCTVTQILYRHISYSLGSGRLFPAWAGPDQFFPQKSALARQKHALHHNYSIFGIFIGLFFPSQFPDVI